MADVLKVALRPKWIGVLIIALILASLFAFLANWQFTRAKSRSEPPESATEQARPFTDVAAPEEPLSSDNASRKVTLTGHYRPQQQIVVPARKLKGEKGYWVVTMFTPKNAEVSVVEQRGRPIVVPIVRGWTQSKHDAATSRAPKKTISMTARIQRSEGPTSTVKMPAGEMATLSTAQLVNKWDVLTYSAYLLPMEQSGPGADAAAAGLTRVPAPPPETGWNVQSLFYAIEWVVFALFAVYVWWRMVRDEYLREIEDAELANRMGEQP